MVGQKELYGLLNELNIEFEYLEHPPIPTIEDALKLRGPIDALFCKNLFFRNHKGKKHYLVCFDHSQQLAIRDLEQLLKQGKISFASGWRMDKYLGLKPGSVSPFGLINDTENHVKVFLDEAISKAEKVAFHPNDNRGTLILSTPDFIKYMDHKGNQYEFITLY